MVSLILVAVLRPDMEKPGRRGEKKDKSSKENNMAYQNDYNLSSNLAEELLSNGLDGLP